MKDSFGVIHQSHQLNGSSNKLKNYYHSWAPRYNQDVAKEKYAGPNVTASIVSMLRSAYFTKDLEPIYILDSGCGTGLVGEALAQHGFLNIDGFDLSKDMVGIAANIGVYHKLWSDIDLSLEPSEKALLPIQQKAYDIAVCCGVFTLGHLQPAALLTLRSFIRPNGFLVVSTRSRYLRDSGFKKISDRLVQEGYFASAICIPDSKYIAEENAHYWVYQSSSL